MGVESQVNAVQSLQYIKDNLKITPEIVVHDLSPNLISATAEVFGEEKIALDPFHVMQDLNRAILKDLGRMRKARFTAEKVELDLLKQQIILRQNKPVKKNVEILPLSTLPIKNNHEIAKKCQSITEIMLKIYSIHDVPTFFEKIKMQIAEFRVNNFLPILAFGLSLHDELPKYAETSKAMQRIKSEILKKLKTLFRECQRPLMEAQRRFNKIRWVIFYQREHLNPKRADLLLNFLHQYPELQKYRDLTLSIGSIYRLPIELINSKLIDECPVDPEWGNELKACLNTLKRNTASIFRFRNFFEKNPNTPNKCRANMEYQNIHVQRIFRSGNNMKCLNRIKMEMQQHLGGEVRNFLLQV